MDENNNQVNYGPDPVNGGAPNYGPGPVNPNQQPPVYDAVNPGAGAATGSSGMSIGSLVCGILSLLGSCWCCGLSLIVAIVAIVLGIIGKKKGGRGMAIAGIITGAIALVISVIYVILVIIGMINGNTSTYSYYGY